MPKFLLLGEIIQYIRDNTTNNACMTCVIRLNITTIYIVIFQNKYTYHNIIYLLFN